MTSEVIRHIDSESGIKIAFLLDKNQVAILSKSLLTLWDINNLENCFLFHYWPIETCGFYIVFQTSNYIVICTQLLRNDNISDYCISDYISDLTSDALLQVWHVTGPTHLFSLDIKILINSHLFLVPK